MIEKKKSIGKVSSETLGNYVGSKLKVISHLKLQKILYYIQAFHLAYYEEPLFNEKFQAWVHGPVLRSIYDKLKDKSLLHAELHYVRNEKKHLPLDVLKTNLTKDQIELIDEVISVYGKMTGLQLEKLTHSEKPWIEARGKCQPGDRCSDLISNDTMKKYYKKALYGKKSN